MPASKRFQLTLLKDSRSTQDVLKDFKAVKPDKKLDWKEFAGFFKISKRLVGYTDVDEFLNFIDLAKANTAGSSSGLLERFNQGSIRFALILILLGGLA